MSLFSYCNCLAVNFCSESNEAHFLQQFRKLETFFARESLLIFEAELLFVACLFDTQKGLFLGEKSFYSKKHKSPLKMHKNSNAVNSWNFLFFTFSSFYNFLHLISFQAKSGQIQMPQERCKTGDFSYFRGSLNLNSYCNNSFGKSAYWRKRFYYDIKGAEKDESMKETVIKMHLNFCSTPC